MAAESIAAESIAAELEPLGSGVNELAENEFGDSDLAENSVVDSGSHWWGQGTALVQSTPAAGIRVRSSTT